MIRKVTLACSDNCLSFANLHWPRTAIHIVFASTWTHYCSDYASNTITLDLAAYAPKVLHEVIMTQEGYNSETLSGILCMRLGKHALICNSFKV